MTKVARWAMVPMVGVLALLSAGPAFAGTSAAWRLNGVPLIESTPTTWKGTMKLTDTKAAGPVGGECQVTAEGTSGVAGAGEITKWTASSCAPLEDCQKNLAVEIEAVNLPWHIELAKVEGAIHDSLVSSGKGTPGYKIKCKVLGSKVEDECTGTLRATATNTTEGVTSTFNAAEKLACTFGGAGSGVLEGSQKITPNNGGKLSAEAEEPPVWLGNGVQLAAANNISWKGTIAMSILRNGGTNQVNCEDAGSGTAGAGAAGEITTWTTSNCGGNALCSSAGASIQALHLPWHTELLEGAREAFTETGKGTPGFKLTCKSTGETFTDECTKSTGYVPFAPLTNTETGTTAAFNKREELTCVQGHAFFEGSQAISLNSGALLHVRY